MFAIVFLVAVAIAFLAMGYFRRIWMTLVAIVPVAFIAVFWQQGVNSPCIAICALAAAALMGGNKFRQWREMNYLRAEDHVRELHYSLNCTKEV